MNKFADFLEAFQKRELQSSKIFAVVTVTKTLGSSPQDLGARMIADESGLIYGTVGGGKVEAHCIGLVKDKILAKKVSTDSITINLQRDIGMTCGGEMSFLFEFFGDEKKMNFAVFGAGHVSQELVPLLLKLNSRVQVFDSREEWLAKYEKHKNLEVTSTDDMPSWVPKLLPETFVLLMTMGHATDLPILAAALKRKDWSYLGVIGSEQKRNSLEKHLKQNGFNVEDFKNFKCPIGLPLGNNEPFQISISIISEILQSNSVQ